MSARPEDICPKINPAPRLPTMPAAPAIYPTSVWVCNDTDQADLTLGGQQEGYIYQRDRHPNADQLVAKCCQLHGAEQGVVTASGMAALSVAMLSFLKTGDHLVIGHQLYGRSMLLLTAEAERLGIATTLVDPADSEAVTAALRDNTKMMVVETIANPCLEVVDIELLSSLCHEKDALLLVDNTFATPCVCRPLSHGADLVLESVSKLMNGHSDVMLGFLGGAKKLWERVPQVASTWGLAAPPFDCWLAMRGLSTLALRVTQAQRNAQAIAAWLDADSRIAAVDYPGLPDHPQHELARRQFQGQFGNMVTFHLSGGREAANHFIRGAADVPFCPSLGDVATTLSHPESTSHRGLSQPDREALGISGGTIRLSLGVESEETIREALEAGLRAVGGAT